MSSSASPTRDDTPDCCPQCGSVAPVETAGSARDLPCHQCGRLLWFVCRKAGSAVVLTFRPGLIVGSECTERLGEVTAAIAGAPLVVLNLSELPFMSSLFIGMLVALDRRVKAAGGRLRLCGLRPQTHEALSIAKLDTVLSICADESAALAGNV
jgi:anti-anti-sigma factor